GSSASNLLAEKRNDGSRGLQHIAESNHAEASRRTALMQRLQDDLREALGRAHHIGRIDGFVRRNENESFDAALQRRLGRVHRAEDVVVDSFDDVLLHDRHVLVGGRVVDRLNPVDLQDLFHSALVMRITEQSHQFDLELLGRDQGPKLALDVIQRKLRHLEEQNLRRTQPNDLTAKLGADGSARTGHHHDLAADTRIQEARIGRDGVSAEQVPDIDIANVLDARRAGENVTVVGDGLDQYRERLERFQYFLTPTTRLRWQSQEHRCRPLFTNERRQRAKP